MIFRKGTECFFLRREEAPRETMARKINDLLGYIAVELKDNADWDFPLTIKIEKAVDNMAIKLMATVYT